MRSTIKIVILLFFICTSMSGASFPDMEKVYAPTCLDMGTITHAME